MLEIRLLGGFELALSRRLDTGRLGPKTQGLLAVLAMSRGATVSRGRLAGLLWGERDEDLARHSLSQALTTVRVALGPIAADIVEACPDGLRLAREDARARRRRVRERRLAAISTQAVDEACRLYRGEFLEGLEIRSRASRSGC